MNWAHVHLLLNHLPVIGTFIALALLVLGIVARNQSVARTSLGISLCMGLAAIAVYFTGEPAEEAVEHLSTISKSAIETHEAAALAATLTLVAMGLLAGHALLRSRRGQVLARPYLFALLIANAVPAGLSAWTANLGGKIHHEEIRNGALVEANTEHDED
jgi:hypothetical protein